MSKQRNLFLACLAAYLWALGSAGAGLKVALLAIAWLATGGVRWCYLAKKTIRRDLRLAYHGGLFMLRMRLVKIRDENVAQVFRKVVAATPSRAMFVDDSAGGRVWTYRQVEELSNRVANYFLGQGFRRGDAVALLMENRAEFVAVWLGLAKVGVVPAFINTNLRGQSLVHCVAVAKSRAVIYGLELEGAVKEVLPALEEKAAGEEGGSPGFRAFYSAPAALKGSASGMPAAEDLDALLEAASPDREPERFDREIGCLDPLLYIYTSGTTGLPKAVVIKHLRQLFTCLAIPLACGIRPDDIHYCYLPLYHSSGGQLGIGGALFHGTTTVIKKKFSASNFWKDCVKYDVTVTQYIGEICRFLLAAAKTPEESQHRVRMMVGNGLKRDIWARFVDRFGIDQITEFYGATEGNSSMVNMENHVGACGFSSRLIPRWFHNLVLPLDVIRVDKETGEPVRGPDGLCIQAAVDEPGEFVGKVVRGHPIKDFEGYKDKEATKKKLLTDVFRRGDVYFRSGDIFVMDELGWLYFQDRAGDTFRWKGENVSTQEVEAAVSDALEMKEAAPTVYGVLVPAADGRAGMVAIPAASVGGDVDLGRLHAGVKERLPAYARPAFVRIVKEMDLTGTFKLKKSKLQEEGFDPAKVADPVYVSDPRQGRYVRLTAELLEELNSGKLRL